MADKCITVVYPDGEPHDELLLWKKNGSEHIFKGHLIDDRDASATLLIDTPDKTKYTVNKLIPFI